MRLEKGERLMRMGLGKMLLCSCMAAFVFLGSVCQLGEGCFAGVSYGMEQSSIDIGNARLHGVNDGEPLKEEKGVKNAGFSDLGAGHWAYEEVSMLADAGVLDGYPDGCFRPAQEVTYGEFIKMVCAAVGDVTEVSEDVKAGHWAQEYYDAALEAGFLKRNVIEAGMLDMKIPRKHMAHVAAGVLDSISENTESDRSSEMSGMESGHIKRSWIKNAAMSYSEAAKMLSDVSAASEHGDDIITSVAAGVLTGYPDGEFKGNATLTRAEATAVVGRILRLVQGSDAAAGDGETEPGNAATGDGEAGSEHAAGKDDERLDEEIGAAGATDEVIVRKVQKGTGTVEVEYHVYEKRAAELGIAKIEQESGNTIRIYAEKKYPFIKIMLKDGKLLKSVGFPGGSFYEEDRYFVYVADPEGRDLSEEIAAGELYLVVDDEVKRAYRVSGMQG